ncbi:MAG: hypothetical protein ACOX7N_00855 [Lawsonibacter sp.]|jgi:hypothetical protein
MSGEQKQVQHDQLEPQREKRKQKWFLPHLGRKGKTVRNLLLTVIFAIFIWGQYGYPLPTAKMEFRRLERTYLLEPSEIVFATPRGEEFQAADGIWLALSHPAVVGIDGERAVLGHAIRAAHPILNTLMCYPLESGPSPVPMGHLQLWWVPVPGETKIGSPLLWIRMPEDTVSGELEMDVTYRGRDYHRECPLFDLGGGIWMAGIKTPESGYGPDWYKGGSYVLRLYDAAGTLFLEQSGTIPKEL